MKTFRENSNISNGDRHCRALDVNVCIEYALIAMYNGQLEPFPCQVYLVPFLPKTGVLDGNCIITEFLSKHCQIFDKYLIETPVLGRNV